MWRYFLSFLLVFMQTACFAKTPIILDTDMGFDDWVAVLYVLENKNVEVKAITIDCNGLSYCPQGAVNAAKLALIVNKRVPIYLGRVDESLSAFQFPKVLRDYSSDMAVPGFNHLPSYAFDKAPAARAIVQLSLKAQQQQQPLTIVSLGSAVNLSDALLLAKGGGHYLQFKKGIKRIYKGGGAFGLTLKDKNNKSYLSNYNIQGNLSIPGIYASNNTTAEWNVYAAVDAMQTLMQAHLPLTWVSINASDMAHITPQALDYLDQQAKGNKALQFTLNAARQVVELQGGWEKIASNLDFWDTAVTIAALNSDVVSERFVNLPVCLNDKNSNYQMRAEIPSFVAVSKAYFYWFPAPQGHYYGELIINDKRDNLACRQLKLPVVTNDVIKSIDVGRFYKHFAHFN